MSPYYDDGGPMPPPYPPGYGQYYGGPPRRVVYLQPPAPRPYKGPRTSSRELFDLALAVIVLTVVFGMPAGGITTLVGVPLWLIGLLFGSAFVAVMLSIFPHELAHKFMAQRYGCWAEFRRSDYFLVISLLLALFGGFGIAGAGAVMIAGPITKESNGKISAVGPATNALMGALLFPVAVFSGSWPLVQLVAAQIVWVNVVLGIFNMLPVWILDGKKIWNWNPGVYIGLFALLVVFGAWVYLSGILYI
jgi:Zn-dependent protease